MATKAEREAALAFYDEDVRKQPDRVLCLILREQGFEQGTERFVIDAIRSIATDELINRGHVLPYLYALSFDL